MIKEDLFNIPRFDVEMKLFDLFWNREGNQICSSIPEIELMKGKTQSDYMTIFLSFFEWLEKQDIRLKPARGSNLVFDLVKESLKVDESRRKMEVIYKTKMEELSKNSVRSPNAHYLANCLSN